MRSGQFKGSKSLGPLKKSLEKAKKVIVQQKKIMFRSFLNSGTLIVKITYKNNIWLFKIRLDTLFCLNLHWRVLVVVQ